MYCKNCGSEISEDAKFCSQCGTPVAAEPKAAEPKAAESVTSAEIAAAGIDADMSPNVTSSQETDVQQESAEVEYQEEKERPVFEEFDWNITDYPSRSKSKTDDIDFNWNANPNDIPDDIPVSTPYTGTGTSERALHSERINEEINAEPEVAEENNVLKGEDLERSIFGDAGSPEPEDMSAADRIDKFYTFNKKNEEFQQLLDREYNKVKSGNAIEHELSQAEERSAERFGSRHADATMEEFLESEGIVKPYQPKAFESDVLQRIEAQDAEREAKRLEEEARLAALEEARKEAEAKKLEEEEARRQAEEEAAKLEVARAEAKAKAEAEAKRLEEIARAKAAEEARLAEEARIKAEAEAKIKAEEEARQQALEEARRKAEAEAKVKAEEEARLRAEADLRAAQEAAKIKAQQEARRAAEEEARLKSEQESRRLADIQAQKRLEEERNKITAQANKAVAQEEARKVLEQTAKMREEEAAKIRAAVAGLRAGVSAEKAAADVAPVRKEVQEAHRATKNQINEMAKARDAYFAEYEDTPAPLGRETMLSDDLVKTRAVNKKAILAGLADDTKVVPKRDIEEAAVKAVPQDEEMQQTAQEAYDAQEGLQDEDDAFFNSLNAVPEEPVVMDEAEAQPIDFREEDFTEVLPEEPELLQQTQQFSHEEFNSATMDVGLQDTVVMQKNDQLDAFAANDFDNYGNEEAQNYINQQEQQQDEMYKTNQAMDEFYTDDFDEADESQLSKKELKQKAKEEKRLEKQRAKEEKANRKKAKKGGVPEPDFSEADDYEDDYNENSGGKGRIALKVILVILIIILAAELAGMGIKFLAPQSKAAEFIDSQLNKVIQLITGEDTEYSVIAAQVRTEPMEDKTDLITAQKSKNKDGNIKSIEYSADLAYDQNKNSGISDLVLSQPMTLVEWGRDKENYPIYYDEQVVGKIIAFESQKINLMNNGDEKALSNIDAKSDFYSQAAALKNQKAAGEFTKLEIGEIRQAGSNYYVWVRETIGGTSAEKVYSMYPEKKFVLKIAACYEF